VVKSLFSAILVGNRKASLEARRHREEKKKYKCSVYFVHGNTVAKKNATVSWRGKQPEGGEVFHPPLSL
jgi:hypothetical protein